MLDVVAACAFVAWCPPPTPTPTPPPAPPPLLTPKRELLVLLPGVAVDAVAPEDEVAEGGGLSPPPPPPTGFFLDERANFIILMLLFFCRPFQRNLFYKSGGQ